MSPDERKTEHRKKEFNQVEIEEAVTRLGSMMSVLQETVSTSIYEEVSPTINNAITALEDADDLIPLEKQITRRVIAPLETQLHSVNKEVSHGNRVAWAFGFLGIISVIVAAFPFSSFSQQSPDSLLQNRADDQPPRPLIESTVKSHSPVHETLYDLLSSVETSINDWQLQLLSKELGEIVATENSSGDLDTVTSRIASYFAENAPFHGVRHPVLAELVFDMMVIEAQRNRWKSVEELGRTSSLLKPSEFQAPIRLMSARAAFELGDPDRSTQLFRAIYTQKDLYIWSTTHLPFPLTRTEGTKFGLLTADAYLGVQLEIIEEREKKKQVRQNVLKAARVGVCDFSGENVRRTPRLLNTLLEHVRSVEVLSDCEPQDDYVTLKEDHIYGDSDFGDVERSIDVILDLVGADMVPHTELRSSGGRRDINSVFKRYPDIDFIIFLN